MTSRAWQGFSRQDVREVQFDGLESGGLLYAGGAQGQIWLR
jgi:hypothetical protein